MIPSVICRQYKKSLIDFIETTFPISSPLFKDMLKNFLEMPGKVFRAPYVSVRLPFRKSAGKDDYFQAVKLKYPPYVHQVHSFKRLTGDVPKSTLVATGTGSGKTECFLYPVIDYCYKNRSEKGVKAILVYPMNALASDQAARIAKVIFDNKELNSNTRAGIFVRERDENPSVAME